MNSVLITGGLGFVGGRLVKKLSQDFNLVVSSRMPATSEVLALHGNIDQIGHQELLSKDTFPKKIDTVIHLASLNEWDCLKYPSEAIRVNIDETRIILENSIATGVKNFIYFSTSHIYGSAFQQIITETSLPFPEHPYAITHKAAEDYVLAATKQKKIHSLLIRLSNSFGAPVMPTVNRWTLLTNDLCRQTVEKRKLTLLSNGCQYRDFVCLTDVENILLTILQRDPQHFNKLIYNLGGVSMRVLDMAEAIVTAYRKLSGTTLSIELPDGAEPTQEPKFEYSVERLVSEGCQIQNNFSAELEALLRFCQVHFSFRD